MNKALDEVRAVESRKMAQQGHPPLFKKSRWCVLNRKQNLTATTSRPSVSISSKKIFISSGNTPRLWEYTSPTWAGMFLDFWCYQTMRSRIEPMKKIARTLRAHRTLLLNYFKARKQFSSGADRGAEQQGQSNHEKILWLSHLRILELALYHSRGKLPEPDLAHEFF